MSTKFDEEFQREYIRFHLSPNSRGPVIRDTSKESRVEPMLVDDARAQLWSRAPLEVCRQCDQPTGHYGESHRAICTSCKTKNLMVKERREVARITKEYGQNALIALGWVE